MQALQLHAMYFCREEGVLLSKASQQAFNKLLCYEALED